MTMLDFTVEEVNLIAIYKDETKIATISRISEVYPHMDEDMKDIANNAARKLSVMTEEEFATAKFIPAEDE